MYLYLLLSTIIKRGKMGKIINSHHYICRVEFLARMQNLQIPFPITDFHFSCTVL